MAGVLNGRDGLGAAAKRWERKEVSIVFAVVVRLCGRVCWEALVRGGCCRAPAGERVGHWRQPCALFYCRVLIAHRTRDRCLVRRTATAITSSRAR